MARGLHIGVLSAMPEEIGSDLSHVQQLRSEQHGDLTIHHGSWGDDIRLSLAWSGWVKVGAANPALKQWDVVLANAVVQHDMEQAPSSRASPCQR